MTDRIGEEFRFYQEAINLRQRRQEVLAANIANADTPHYKARDFEFSQALKAAMQQPKAGRPATELALTSVRHIPGKAHMPDVASLLYRQPLQPSLDGNTVDMDTERVQFADNTQRYQADLALISARIKSMMSALQQ
ncbi:flagellar basal body rod protein FlgB [Alcaligenaceae bacterium]|nr:flagellar basal body rod protein FlgB [Alcaligenaceae bacterium]